MMKQRAVAVLAVLFGTATMLAGSRVPAGTDPGYIVLRPPLDYKTVMGVVYIAAGIRNWRDLRRRRIWAGSILARGSGDTFAGSR
jgi:hypothetical protein